MTIGPSAVAAGSGMAMHIDWDRFSCTAPVQRNDPPNAISDCLYLKVSLPPNASKLIMRILTVTVPIDAKVVGTVILASAVPSVGRPSTNIRLVF